MPIPTGLKKLTDDALNRMKASADHQIAPPILAEMHNAFGIPIDPIANRARGYVAILTAEHVLPIWKAHLPNETTPDQVLVLAHEILMGNANIDEVYDFADHARYMLGNAVDNMDLDLGEYSFQADFAGKTTHNALRYLIHLYCFTRKISLYGYRELEPEDLNDPWAETMITAVQAYAGIDQDEYGEWSGKFDPVKCQTFWQWWLTEAIPAAWDNK
jgi:hypothetical protein